MSLTIFFYFFFDPSNFWGGSKSLRSRFLESLDGVRNLFFLGGKESRAGAGIFLGGLFRWWLIKRYFENKKFLVILLFVILFLFS